MVLGREKCFLQKVYDLAAFVEGPQSVIGNLNFCKHMETLIHSITVNFLALYRDLFPCGLGHWEYQGTLENWIQASILNIT